MSSMNAQFDLFSLLTVASRKTSVVEVFVVDVGERFVDDAGWLCILHRYL